jgi:hypothetical protein
MNVWTVSSTGSISRGHASLLPLAAGDEDERLTREDAERP